MVQQDGPDRSREPEDLDNEAGQLLEAAAAAVGVDGQHLHVLSETSAQLPNLGVSYWFSKLYSPDTQVVSIVIWELWENGQYVELSALGVLFIIALFVMVLIAQWLGKKYGVKE